MVRPQQPLLVSNINPFPTVLHCSDQHLTTCFPLTLIFLVDEPHGNVDNAGLSTILDSVLEEVEENLTVEIPVAVESLVLGNLFFHSDCDLFGFE